MGRRLQQALDARLPSSFRVILKQTEDDALEECMLVMAPCDPEAPDDEDECLDEEVSPSVAKAPGWCLLVRISDASVAGFPPEPAVDVCALSSARCSVRARRHRCAALSSFF